MKTVGQPIMWKCTYCNKQFKYESEKIRHEQSHVPQFECKICSKKFSFLSALRRHEKQHDRTGSVQCSKCGGNFRDETLLKRHMQYAHKGSYTCTKCNTIFNSEAALNTHNKSHKPEAERRFRCTFSGCEKTFNFSHHLKHHELTHTDAKQHYCKVCGKGFIQSNHLKIHMKSHDPDNWLPCYVAGCNKKFSYEYARKRHLSTHKNKADSGISSDSSTACDATLSVQDKSHCDSCGQMISQRLYKKHIKQCSRNNEKSEDFSVTSLEISLNEISQKLDLKTEKNIVPFDEKDELTEVDIADSNCKTILGGCIVSGGTEINEKCLCAQIAPSVDEYESMLVPNDNVNATTYVVKLIDGLKTDTEYKAIKEPNEHRDCNCASMFKLEETPEIEYRLDGTIKIKKTFDVDIITSTLKEDEGTDFMAFNEDDEKKPPNDKHFPFNSCKDVLGNCIVSGNGTMGDECLCAKMIADDQQMIAQQIEEITPCPKNTWLSQRL